MDSFAVIIPAYNEAQTIRDIVERVIGICDHVIVIDDGSVDGTAGKLDGLGVTVLQNESNAGKAASLWRGMQAALESGFEAVITLDGDGQHRPEDIPAFLEAAAVHSGAIIIGSRLHDREKIPTRRYRANRFANFWIAWASGYPIEDSQSGFRLYPSGLLKDLNLDTRKEKSFVFESEILIEAGWRKYEIVGIKIPAIYGEALRPSHFRSVRDIARITQMVAGRLLSKGMNLPGFYRAFVSSKS